MRAENEGFLGKCVERYFVSCDELVFLSGASGNAWLIAVGFVSGDGLMATFTKIDANERYVF